MKEVRIRSGNPAVRIREFTIGKIRSTQDRTVEAVVSSEHPVPRFDGNEVLVHTPEAVDLSRAPLPLIIAHDDRTLPVGIVENLTIQEKELFGVLRISKSQDAVWNDIQDGILRSLSIGYIPQRTEPPEDGQYRVTKWLPYEVSLVAAPADPTAKIKREMETETVDVNDLKKDRKAAKEKMVTLAKTRELTDEQKTELAGLKEQVRTLSLQIEALEMDEPEPDNNTGTQNRGIPKLELGVTHRATPEYRASKEYRGICDKLLRYGKAGLDSTELQAVHRTMQVGNDVSMGFALHEEFETTMVKAQEEANIMRSLCKVIKTGSDRKIPVQTGHVTANWISEKGTYTPSDPEIGQIFLSAYKLGVLSLASEELVYDLAFDLGNFIAEDAGRAMGDKEEDAFINGDGATKPHGILTTAPVGVTTASISAITGDELIDLVHALKRSYRKRAVFLMSDDALQLLRKLKDSNGNYIYQESLKEGEPSKLLGRPVYVSDSMGSISAGTTPILYGDLSYCWIADRQGRFFQELRERYAEIGQIGYKINQRVDGALVLPEAVTVLKMKAS
jgi:HK97 family phage major capsid protein